MAVVTLGEFTGGVSPIPLTVSSHNPLGQMATLVGYGTHGTGQPPFEGLSDDLRRAATNMVDLVNEAGEDAGEIRLDFDHPSDPDFSTMGSTVPTELEGTPGVGDSGGPLLVGDRLVGVLHGGINPTRFDFSEYGDVAIYAGVFDPRNIEFLKGSGVLVVGGNEPADRVTVEVTARPGLPYVASPDGRPACDGTVVRIGSFPSNFDVVAAGLGDVARAWLPFGEGEVRHLASEPGHLSASVTGDGRDFTGKQIYWWVLETAQGLPTADLGNITAWGLFSSSAPQWVFPVPGSAPPANAVLLDSGQIDVAGIGGQIHDGKLVMTAVSDLVLDYETWSRTVFPPAIPISSRIRTADYDRDGLDNASEWVFGTSPLHEDTVKPQLSITTVGGGLVFRFVRRRFLPPDAYRIELSSNLLDWRDATFDAESLSILEGAREEVIGNITAPRSLTFWRLNISNN